MSDKPDFRERMYQRSIDVYMYQGQKNSTWMKLYAIFTGAFFVAFYEFIDKCQPFIFLILIMGLFTSICWLGAYHAYHSWLKSYVKTMHLHENQLLKMRGAEFKYSRLHTLGFSKNLKKGDWLPGLSGDKINKLFIFLVVLGWVFLLAFYVCKTFELEFRYCVLAVIIICVILVLSIIFILLRNLKSNGIKNMWMVNIEQYEQDARKKKYEIKNPDEEILIVD